MKLILIASLFWLHSAAGISAQDLRPIYDARKTPNPIKTIGEEESVLKREILPAARRHWSKQNSAACDEDFEVVDIAKGAFTKPQTIQKAVLYRYCITGHNFALNGIAIIEEGQTVAHVVYEGGVDNAVGAVPDIDGNGHAGIIIATGGTNQGETWGVISLIELSEKAVRKFGQAETLLDNCLVEENKGNSTAYRIYVKTGATPIFYREMFVSSCGESSKWSRKGIMKQYALGKDEIKYRRLK